MAKKYDGVTVRSKLSVFACLCVSERNRTLVDSCACSRQDRKNRQETPDSPRYNAAEVSDSSL